MFDLNKKDNGRGSFAPPAVVFLWRDFIYTPL